MNIHYFLDTGTGENLYTPFLMIAFNCLKATEPLRGDSLLLTNKSPGVSGTHFMDESLGGAWSRQWLNFKLITTSRHYTQLKCLSGKAENC